MKVTDDYKIVASPEEAKEPVKESWHRPQLQKLHISLDTMNRPGSGADFGTLGSGTV